jgi:hypothetical protein
MGDDRGGFENFLQWILSVSLYVSRLWNFDGFIP